MFFYSGKNICTKYKVVKSYSFTLAHSVLLVLVATTKPHLSVCELLKVNPVIYLSDQNGQNGIIKVAAAQLIK